MKWLICCLLASPLFAKAVALEDSVCRIAWESTAEGWKVSEIALITPDGKIAAPAPNGGYTVLFSSEKPPPGSRPFFLPGAETPFPEPVYRYNIAKWAQATTPVALNEAGEAWNFWPQTAELQPDGSLLMNANVHGATLQAQWQLDPSFPGDLVVTQTLTAGKAGFYSLSTPTLYTAQPHELNWAVVPGYFQGDSIQSNLVLSLAYGHGLPDLPVLARERGVSTLTSIQTIDRGITLAVTASPGTAADPWPKDHAERATWRLGLSHRNRAAELAPTLYHPVIGEAGSFLKAGESVSFTFRYSLTAGDWYDALRHVSRDIYQLPHFLQLKRPEASLSQRLIALGKYVVDDQSSMWRTARFGGCTIGAQAYLGGVVGSDRDAMKNSDYGAMWMLASLTSNPRLTEERLPFARNFKQVQQHLEKGFLQGAPLGQYYLSKAKRFTEEWGNYVEPVGVTYYNLIDIGNILLFSPDDQELRERLRQGAERLLTWQHPDGHWEVAYDLESEQPRFTETPDYRPTFYGLLAAYHVLGDPRYLEAAERGAQWLMDHAVAEGRFLGVCGDNRFVPDFATAQIAQGLLDLYEITGQDRYREAAIQTARFYTTSIFTHPRPTRDLKQVAGKTVPDWAISQAGLSFEHGGSIGSAATEGPILLASHAGLFIRLAELTGDTYFAVLARAATVARDAFVDPETQVASYYWIAMNRGAGPYPHHAWWQIGWIIDYLISEASYRSGGAIHFPRGFMAPKVGPHSSYGFAPGLIYGRKVKLAWSELDTGNPAIDYLVADAPDDRRRYVILLNESPEVQEAKLEFADDGQGQEHWLVNGTGEVPLSNLQVSVPGFGVQVVAIDTPSAAR